MNKKDKKTLSSLIALLIIAPQLLFMNWIQENIPFMDNVYVQLFTLILLPVVIASLIIKLIPDKKKSKVKKIATLKKLVNSHLNRLRSDKEILTSTIEDLSWREFEQLIFLYYSSKRGHKARLTSAGKDGGVDLIYYSPKHRGEVAVQIKFWEKKQISVKEIRELNTAKRNHDCVLCEFITYSTFSNDALRETDKFKIETYDYSWIENTLIPWKEKQVQVLRA